MSGWMKGRGVQVKKVTDAEGQGGGWKNGDKVNCVVERIAMDSTDNENVIKQHGQDGADNFINIMLRVLGDKDGRFKKSVIFHKLFMFSENAVRASGDCQFLASYAALQDEGDQGYYADLIESDQEPDNEILENMIGLEVGITVGVMNDGGRESVFVRKLSAPFDFEKEAAAPANNGGRSGRSSAPAGGDRGRGRAGAASEAPADSGRGRGRGRS